MVEIARVVLNLSLDIAGNFSLPLLLGDSILLRAGNHRVVSQFDFSPLNSLLLHLLGMLIKIIHGKFSNILLGGSLVHNRHGKSLLQVVQSNDMLLQLTFFGQTILFGNHCFFVNQCVPFEGLGCDLDLTFVFLCRVAGARLVIFQVSSVALSCGFG